MLSNKNAGKLYDTMKKLYDANIEMNCQIVLCPGVNDKDELNRTLEDLSHFYPYVNSAAVVPVGLTKHREGLFELDIFNKESSKELINQIREIQSMYLNKLGTRFVFLSDEFYIIGDEKLLDYDEYEGFIQLENGVGLMCKFESEVHEYIKNLPKNKLSNKKKVSIATGSSSYEFMKKIASYIMNNISGLDIVVYKINNVFFGETITVSGLITASDIVSQLKDKDLGENLFIPRSMLKADEEVFLDDITLEGLSKKLNIDVVPCKVEAKDFIDKLLK
jgi:putative radical SAM enzyme (TIGR03279 family)